MVIQRTQGRFVIADTQDNAPRMAREKRTIRAMVGIYCRDHHATDGQLCDECAELVEYAYCRLDRCPFGEEKPTCAKCPIHCYKPEMRTRTQEVMKYAGPRMVLRHPWLALSHTVDAMRQPADPAPPKPPKKNQSPEETE